MHVNTKALKRGFVGVRKVAVNTRTPEAERCAYCRALLQPGEARTFLDGEQTVYVHRRHPKRAGEQPASEEPKTELPRLWDVEIGYTFPGQGGLDSVSFIVAADTQAEAEAQARERLEERDDDDVSSVPMIDWIEALPVESDIKE